MSNRDITLAGENKMDLKLQDKRVLITGSTSGIGEAIAKTLATEGASVVVQGRRETEAQRVAAEIKATGGKAAIAVGDLATPAGAEAVVTATLNAIGGIDILVNNAGIAPIGYWFETNADIWMDVYNLNVAGMVRLIDRFAPAMQERGWGRIIAISSGEASNPPITQSAYAASKAAVLNLAVSLAKALANTGVTSNAISPGLIWTETVDKLADELGFPQERTEREQKLVAAWAPNPSGRLGRVEEIANAVAFVASPMADYINGANIRVDGGATPTVN
jgi:3-oxoacyl-[acyl-carrier protein] reductase